MDMNKVRFGYFRVKTANGIGYACLALIRAEKDSGGNCKVGVSFCSPKDKFNKKMARKIAFGRLQAVPVEFKDIPGSIFKDMYTALKHYVSTEKAPGWFSKQKEMVFLGLNDNSTHYVNLSLTNPVPVRLLTYEELITNPEMRV